MFRYFTSRPLHMSLIRNTMFYIFLGLVINNSIHELFVTDSNPEGLTGFPHYVVFLFTMAAMVWMIRQENGWVNEIRFEQEMEKRRNSRQ